MPRIRIDASPNVLQVDRGSDPIVSGLSSGLHSIWEGNNRAAEINRQGERDQRNQEMQLWARSQGEQDRQFAHGQATRAEARQGRLDERQKLLDEEAKADRAAARKLEERRVGALEQSTKAKVGGVGRLSEKDARRLALAQAEAESIDRWGAKQKIAPERLEEIYQGLIQPMGGAAGGSGGDENDPMGLYGGQLWGAPHGHQGAPAVPASIMAERLARNQASRQQNGLPEPLGAAPLPAQAAPGRVWPGDAQRAPPQAAPAQMGPPSPRAMPKGYTGQPWSERNMTPDEVAGYATLDPEGVMALQAIFRSGDAGAIEEAHARLRKLAGTEPQMPEGRRPSPLPFQGPPRG